jgi:hypothetical protein
MSMAKLARPPELPAHRRRKQADLIAMSFAYMLTALVFGGACALGFAAVSQTAAPPVATSALIAALIVLYLSAGAALCGFFVRKLSGWVDADLAHTVRRELLFVWIWPIAAAHLLLLLVVNRLSR